MDEICKQILQHRIIVIFRRLYGEALIETVKALYTGGIRLVEVTFDQNDEDHIQKTSKAIVSVKSAFPDMSVGAGTVITTKQVIAAAEAGAQFIISPNTNTRIIKLSKKFGLISIPGALTPTEILAAHEAGADFVKIFPAKSLGIDYIKDLTGPINHVKFIATAGVNEQNFQDYLKVGCIGAGISGRLTDSKVIDQGNFHILTDRAKTFVQQVISYNKVI
jgi:2-dehydro-3-deoxyphosphogluconate aldolase/(4S)-4-hydroxy-2-oxoglutarate aldolase